MFEVFYCLVNGNTQDLFTCRTNMQTANERVKFQWENASVNLK